MTYSNTTNTQSFKKDIIRIFILALTAFYCVMPLFIHHGIPYIDDMSFHMLQADQFSLGIEEGLFYPRWMLDSNKGYGSPNFIFYSPLSYYFLSSIKIFAHSLITSMIIAIWFSFFLSGIAMFITTRKLFGGSGSLMSSIIYQLFPYHLFVLFIRGAFAELFAFVWFPLIFLFLYKIIETRDRNAIVGLSISYAGLILTHLVSGYIFSFAIGAYLIYHFFLFKKIKILLKPLLSLALGLSLSSIYLAPVIFERKFVHIEYLVTCSICDYKKNFLFMLDKFQEGLRTFYDPLHTAVVLELILFIFIVLLIYRYRQILLNKIQQKFFTFLFIIYFILVTPLSRPIWDFIPGFPFLQFPWRWVSMMELSLCFLIGNIFCKSNTYRITKSSLKRIVIYIIIVVCAASSSLIFRSSSVSSNIEIKKLNIIEYIPIWTTNTKKILSEKKFDKVSVISGLVVIKIKEWKSEKRIIDVNVSNYALLRISTFYYPGWEARIDGKKTPIKIEQETGVMLIEVPEGKHTLELKFLDTQLRFYAKLISLASFSLVLLMLFSKKLGRKQNPKKDNL